MVEIKLEDVAQALFDIQGIRFETTILTGKSVSPFYIDAGLSRSCPDQLDILAQAYLQIIKQITPRPQFLANIPEGTTPLAGLVTHLTRIPLLTPDIKSNNPRLVGGGFKSGDKVAILEDVITTGDSILKGLDILEGHGLVVTDVMVLVDREEKRGREKILERVPKFHRFCTVSELLIFYQKYQMITDDQFKSAWSYFHPS